MIPRGQPRGVDLIVRPARVEASLWRRFRLEAETACRELLFNRYVDFARSLARRHFLRRSPPRPDLGDFQQLAYEGLLQAIDRFDPMKNVPFMTYARRRIVGSIMDGIAQMSEIGAQLSLRRRLERERVTSLSIHTDSGDALPALANLAMGLALGLMLEGTSIVANEDSHDPRPSAYDSLAYHQLQVRLAEAVNGLPEREGILVRQHYENGLSFAQIAQLMNLSPGRVSQLHRSALEKLRKRIGKIG